MTTIEPEPRQPSAWRWCATSVRGPSHEAANTPNQDAVGALAAGPWPSDVRLLAVADGHGDGAHFRSDRGAHLAVDAALGTARDYFASRPRPDQAELWQWAQREHPEEVLSRWRSTCLRDNHDEPFAAAELAALNEHDGRATAANPLRPYGSTLIGAALSETHNLFYQVGDGELVTGSEDGSVFCPFDMGSQAFTNVTHSLAEADPLSAWQFAIQDQVLYKTDLVMICSDGYSSAFEDKSAFLSAFQALAAIWRQGGIAKLQATLENSIAKARVFTGDDATVAIAYRVRRQPR